MIKYAASTACVAMHQSDHESDTVTVRLVYDGETTSTGFSDLQLGQVIERRLGPDDSELVIGRTREVDVYLGAPSVGRRVVRIRRLDTGALHVEDLGSGGGSFLIREERRERPDCELRDGDRLGIGTLEFRVEIRRE